MTIWCVYCGSEHSSATEARRCFETYSTRAEELRAAGQPAPPLIRKPSSTPTGPPRVERLTLAERRRLSDMDRRTVEAAEAAELAEERRRARPGIDRPEPYS